MSCMLDSCFFGALPQHFEFFRVSGRGDMWTPSLPPCVTDFRTIRHVCLIVEVFGALNNFGVSGIGEK